MSTFAVDVSSSSSDIISALNYALANLSDNTNLLQANVLVANTATGEITTTSTNGSGYTTDTIVSYLYQYMAVKYANTSTGSSGFTSNSALAQYYGLRNSANTTISSNPADYVWFQATGGFGTTKSLWYQTIGGRQIAFFVGNTGPDNSFVSVPDMPTANSTPLNLDTVTSAQNNQIVNVNAYYQANIAPATPSGGSYDFTTFTLTAPAGWTANIPSTANTSVYISSAAFTGNSSATAAPPATDWTTPALYATNFSANTGAPGERGFVPMGYVITASDPTAYSNIALTTAYSSSRTNASPPIGLGFAPIQYDTAQFAYQDLFSGNTTTTVKQYDGTGWQDVVGNVISGGLFVGGSITANALNANEVYALTVASTNANVGNIASAGFWLDSVSGNARLAGNTNIGNNLIVGQNAQIGANLNVGSSATVGANLTVGNNAVIGGFTTIGSNVSIGGNLTVGNNTVIGGFSRIGSNVNIGGNLTVGNNAVIGGNLNVSGLITAGSLSNNTVNTTTIITQAVSTGQGISSSTVLTTGGVTAGTFFPYTYCNSSLTTTIPLAQVYVTGIVYVTLLGSLSSSSVFIGLRRTGSAGTSILFQLSAQSINNSALSPIYACPISFFDVITSPGTNTYQIGAYWDGTGSNGQFSFKAGTVVLQQLKR